MITDKTVQEIIDTAKVEDVIEDFVNLKRRGVNMIGLCPFHNEKTPSFIVSPGKNIYKCFGCGKAGNPVGFLMDYENLSFPESLRWLANKYGIEVEETEQSQEVIEQRQLKDSLFLVNDFAKKYYEGQLFETDKGKSIGLHYFKERGFLESTIRDFGLGFAPAKGDAFTLEATQQSYKLEHLQQLGLSTSYGKDFFRDRVMFTLYNLSGKVVGFAGRILQSNVKAPKYINSPETEIYHKSKFLYGAFQAKQDIRKLDECILVEGYTDVISLHQAGVKNVVASSGTSLTVDQILLIKRFTPNIKILYDGDQAGIKAALRGLDLVLEQDLNVKIVLLPDGEDPDSYMQKVGVSAFEAYLKDEAKDFIFFKTDLLLTEAKGDPIQKAKVIQDIVQSIARIPDPIKKSLYVRECANLMEISESLLIEEVNKSQLDILKRRRKDRRRSGANTQSAEPQLLQVAEGSKPAEKVASKNRTEWQERDLARIIVSHGHQTLQDSEQSVLEYTLNTLEPEHISDFKNPTYRKIFELGLELAKSGKQLKEAFWINHSDPDIQKFAIDCNTSPFVYSENWEEKHQILLREKHPEFNFAKDADNAIRRFRLRMLQQVAKENANRIKSAQNGENSNDTGNIMNLLRIQKKINELRDEVAKELGTVVPGR